MRAKLPSRQRETKLFAFCEKDIIIRSYRMTEECGYLLDQGSMLPLSPPMGTARKRMRNMIKVNAFIIDPMDTARKRLKNMIEVNAFIIDPMGTARKR